MFNFLARSHFSISYSASVKGTVVNSKLFAPVPCNASINKTSASHFGPVRIRILRLLAAVNYCLSLSRLPPSAATLLFSLTLSLPCPFLLPTHSSAFPFLHLLFSERERGCREQYPVLASPIHQQSAAHLAIRNTTQSPQVHKHFMCTSSSSSVRYFRSLLFAPKKLVPLPPYIVCGLLPRRA